MKLLETHDLVRKTVEMDNEEPLNAATLDEHDEIDPDECIDCDACVEACPVDACFAEDQLPAEWAKYAEYYKSKASA